MYENRALVRVFAYNKKEYPVHIREEVGWNPEPVRTKWRRGNSLPSRDLNSYTSVVHTVASRYTGYANPAPE
jgi:hypothetical protein